MKVIDILWGELNYEIVSAMEFNCADLSCISKTSLELQ